MGKFTIYKGDYIDSREFSREECERFCELAVECGFGRGAGADRDYQCIVIDPTFNSINSVSGEWVEKLCKNNITQQFREFLDKEKGVSKKAFNNAEFTKSDLKDGVQVQMRNEHVWWVCGKNLLTDEVFYCHGISQGFHFSLTRIKDDLTHDSVKECDIMRVTDRDGTVLFEREEEPREISLEEIAKAFNLPVERVRIKK